MYQGELINDRDFSSHRWITNIDLSNLFLLATHKIIKASNYAELAWNHEEAIEEQ